MSRLLINKSIHEHTPASWVEFVRGLRIAPPTKASKAVPEVTLLFGKRTIVRIARDEKRVSETEIALLALENEKTEQEIRDLLTSRKIKIVNEAGEQTNERAKRVRRAACGKATEANAGSDKPARRKRVSRNKLLQPGVDSDLPAESTVLASQETAE